jgi:hypothetical protein
LAQRKSSGGVKDFATEKPSGALGFSSPFQPITWLKFFEEPVAKGEGSGSDL